MDHPLSSILRFFRGPKRIGYRSNEKESWISGFHLGNTLHLKTVYQQPIVPSSFVERHIASSASKNEDPKVMPHHVPTPQPPDDSTLKKSIDSTAVFVAKGGVMSEELVRQQHAGDHAFAFLFGGKGSEYYRWKVLDVKVTFQKLGVNCIGLREAPLTADDRGWILGDERIEETPSRRPRVYIEGVPEDDRNRVQSALKSTFVKGSDEGLLHVEEAQPGLRAPRPKTDSRTKEPEIEMQKLQDLAPNRFFVDWHPVPLLFKRFNIQDPMKGMPIDAEPKSKFMSYESGLDKVKTEEQTISENVRPVPSIADEINVRFSENEELKCVRRSICHRQNIPNRRWIFSKRFLMLLMTIQKIQTFLIKKKSEKRHLSLYKMYRTMTFESDLESDLLWKENDWRFHRMTQIQNLKRRNTSDRENRRPRKSLMNPFFPDSLLLNLRSF